MVTEDNIFLLYLLTATGIVTVWFATGRLNDFIDAAKAICYCAVNGFLTLLIIGINATSAVIEKKITKPLRKHVHIRPFIGAEIYLLIGLTILLIDQFYGKNAFASDETIGFYHVEFIGQTLWITQPAAWGAGIFLAMGLWYFIKLAFLALDRLLDRQIRISIVVRR